MYSWLLLSRTKSGPKSTSLHRKVGRALQESHVQQHLRWSGSGNLLEVNEPTTSYERRSGEEQCLAYEGKGIAMETWVRLLLVKYPYAGYTQWDLYSKAGFFPTGTVDLYDEDWLATLAWDLATGGLPELPLQSLDGFRTFLVKPKHAEGARRATRCLSFRFRSVRFPRPLSNSQLTPPSSTETSCTFGSE